MSWMTIFLLTLGFITASFLIIGFTLPARWKVEEKIVIVGNRRALYDFLAALRNWEKWTVWNQQVNARYQFEYEGPESGVGAKQVWRFRGKGGSLAITAANAEDTIGYVLDMGKGGLPMQGELALKEVENGVEVVWRSWGDNKQNPAGRIMMWIFVPYMTKDFQKGLQRLKTLMEEGNGN